jgi:hypothetical protein
MNRLPFIMVASLFTVVVAAAIFNVYSTTEYTCLECRATLSERHVCGIPLSRISRHPYTTAYLAANPAHLHSWRWCGNTTKLVPLHAHPGLWTPASHLEPSG